MVYVTHDLDSLLQLADEVVVMHDGRVVRQGAVTAVLEVGGLDTVWEGVVEGDGPLRAVRVHEQMQVQVLESSASRRDDAFGFESADDVLLAVGPVPVMSVRNRFDATVTHLKATSEGWWSLCRQAHPSTHWSRG